MLAVAPSPWGFRASLQPEKLGSNSPWLIEQTAPEDCFPSLSVISSQLRKLARSSLPEPKWSCQRHRSINVICDPSVWDSSVDCSQTWYTSCKNSTVLRAGFTLLESFQCRWQSVPINDCFTQVGASRDIVVCFLNERTAHLPTCRPPLVEHVERIVAQIRNSAEVSKKPYVA